LTTFHFFFKVFIHFSILGQPIYTHRHRSANTVQHNTTTKQIIIFLFCFISSFINQTNFHTMNETSTNTKIRFAEESLLPQNNNNNTNNKNRSKFFNRSVSHVNDELHTFRTYLRWMCVDQSNAFTATLSWFVFILLALAVPAASHFIIACRDCDAKHSRPYDAIVQISLSSVASLSFLCLSSFVRKYGLRRFLFLDKLCDESETVRMNYMTQLNVSILFLSV
jgi:hypothetical protein